MAEGAVIAEANTSDWGKTWRKAVGLEATKHWDVLQLLS